MDRTERLAAHAAGELSGEDRTSLEAELALDAGLRAELEAIRSVDRLLASLPPVAPSAQFSADLRARMREELAQGAAVVSLSEARERRDRWRRPLALVASAAAVAGIVGIGLQTLGGDDLPIASELTMGPADSAITSDAGGGMRAESSLAAPSASPVYASGGRYDKSTLTAIGDRQDVLEALQGAAPDPAGAQSSYFEQLAAAAQAESSSKAPADGTSNTEQYAVDDVSRCVPTIMDDDRVPLFADRGVFEGQSALIVVLGSRDADGTFGRLEFWVLSPDDDCSVRYFAQQG